MKIKYIILGILSITLLVLMSSFQHDIHISKTDIIYNDQTESLEITLHIYIDDLESALALKGYSGLKICTPKEAHDAEVYMDDYLRQHLKITSGAKELEWEFLGKEISDDLFAVWCYMEIVKPELAEDLSVEVNLLTELYEDQKNIVKLQYNHQRKEFFLFDNKKIKGKLAL